MSVQSQGDTLTFAERGLITFCHCPLYIISVFTLVYSGVGGCLCFFLVVCFLFGWGFLFFTLLASWRFVTWPFASVQQAFYCLLVVVSEERGWVVMLMSFMWQLKHLEVSLLGPSSSSCWFILSVVVRHVSLSVSVQWVARGILMITGMCWTVLQKKDKTDMCLLP